MARRGRPRGLTLNLDAFEDYRLRGGADAPISKGEIAAVAGITTGHLSDALWHRKGLSEDKIRLIANRLGCSPATIAPELSGRFLALREGDDEVAA